MGHRGDLRAADLAAATVDFARNNNSPRLLAYAQIAAAEIYNLVELHDRALALARCAAATLEPEPRRLRQAQLAQAHALLGLGAVLEAQTQAHATLQAASEDQDHVSEGIALRVLAESAASSGSSDAARRYMDEALAALELSGRRRVLHEAGRTARKIAKLTR
jgi:hypothetical protein